MLITKFNRLIRNRLLWACIAVIISLAFIGAFAPGSSGCGAPDQDLANAEGLLFGEPVSPREFAMAGYFETDMRDDLELDDEQKEVLRKRTWKRLVALRTAERMGITVSDAAVVQQVQSHPSFADQQGRYRPQQFEQFLRQRWPSWPIETSKKTFEAFMRQELVMRHLRAMLASSLLTSPHEVDRRLSNLTDRFKLHYAVLGGEGITNSVTATDRQALEFYERNPERFRKPERVAVRYVAFPVGRALSQVEISDQQVADYYSDNIADYYEATTNDEPATVPLEKVRAEIAATLTNRMAAFLAEEEAMSFVLSLIPDRRGNALSFDAAAAGIPLTVHTSALFSADEPPAVAQDAGPGFVTAAFDLDGDDPQRSFSDPVVGSNMVYVLTTYTNSEAYVPPFDDVREDVIPLADAVAAFDVLAERGEELGARIADAVRGGATFRVAAESAALNVSTTAPFSLYEGAPEDFEYARRLLPEMLDAGSGHLLDPVPMEDGVLFAWVEERAPGDVLAARLLRPQVMELDSYQVEILFEDWSNALLEQAGFKDLRRTDYGEEDETDQES